MEREAELVRIRIDLSQRSSEQGGASSESFWAEPQGADLYVLHNVPFLAYDLHFLDVVHAIPRAPGDLPEITRIVSRSGHKTLRIVFFKDTSPDRITNVLNHLQAMGVTYESAGPALYSGRLYTLDVEPSADYQAVCDQLYQWELEGWLEYETGMTVDEASAGE